MIHDEEYYDYNDMEDDKENNFVTGGQASSLVLMSAVETTWHLATSSASALPTIFVSLGSKVIIVD